MVRLKKKSSQSITGILEGYKSTVLEAEESINKTHNQTLLLASKLRSKILVDNRVARSLFDQDEYFNDIFRELKNIPRNWISIVLEKSNYILHSLQSGVKGWARLLKEGFLLGLLFGLGVWLFTFVGKSRKFFADILKDDMEIAWYAEETSRLKKFFINLLPYHDWCFFLILIEVFKEALASSQLSELSLLLPYLSYYLYYRMLRTFLTTVLRNLFAMNSYVNMEWKKQISKSIRNLGINLLFLYCLLHTIKSAVSVGIVYSWSLFSLELLFVAHLFLEGSYLLPYAVKRLKLSFKIHPFLKLCRNKPFGDSLSSGSSCFLLSFVILLTARMIRWLEHFEVGKRVSARFFRKKMEAAALDISESERGYPRLIKALISFGLFS